MKINNKILSVPPFISTSWKNIASLHLENQDDTIVLVVTLNSGAKIEVPHLQGSMIEAIFAAHARFIEQEEKPKTSPIASLGLPGGTLPQIFSMEIPFKGVENFGTLLQHNPEQADSPDLPPGVLDKIAELAKTMGVEDSNLIPKPEPHCNCLRCQISKAMQDGLDQKAQVEEEEVVTDEDLKFRNWDVVQTGDKLYIVSNPLDQKEHYNVFLGDTIGCTCGQPHCEHVKAVLST